MSTREKEIHCHRCGEVMQDGYTTALGLIGGILPKDDPKLLFVIPGERTSGNPIKALMQGLQGDQTSRAYLLRGYRCPQCGTVELIALDSMVWTP